MRSTLLQISSRFLGPLLLALSLFVLYRGHNLPGGGFIGGLIAASAVFLVGLAHDWGRAGRWLRVRPEILLSTGLAIALCSAFIGPAGGDTLMSGQWFPAFSLPGLGKVHLGSPLLFDLGVYLCVVGFCTKTVFAMGEQND